MNSSLVNDMPEDEDIKKTLDEITGEKTEDVEEDGDYIKALDGIEDLPTRKEPEDLSEKYDIYDVDSARNIEELAVKIGIVCEAGLINMIEEDKVMLFGGLRTYMEKRDSYRGNPEKLFKNLRHELSSYEWCIDKLEAMYEEANK